MDAQCPRCGWILTDAASLRRGPCPRCRYDVTPAPAPAVHSRWRGSTTTFGPVGRLAWTAVALGPPALLYWAFGPWGLTMCVSWLLIGIPLVLRSVWTRGRVS